MKDLVECVANLKFTKHGVRIGAVPKIDMKRARSNEVSFRIRNNRGNLTANSQFVRPPLIGAPAPGPLRRNGVEDFNTLRSRRSVHSMAVVVS